MPNPYSPEFKYLFDLIQYRVNKSLDASTKVEEPAKPAYKKWGAYLASFIKENDLDKNDEILLLIAMAPHVYPHLFDEAIGEKLGNQNFPKIGGTHGKNFRGFLPTGETAFFIIAGEDQQKRTEVQMLFRADHLFADKKVLWLETMPEGEPAIHGRIIMSQDYLELLESGKHATPHFSMSFPAKRISTNLTWDDLVISNELRQQIAELESWLLYNQKLVDHWEMGDRLKKGYRTLFYGPTGTGKTFTAGLLGKQVKKDVYKIDLSMVVSKYIGETEKNLELLFARAEDKGWILFFDEADALFGKRTSVKDAHDKYANQEVSYLLQRIEDYNGMVILATNMKNNIDDAFLRRFNSILKFSFPDANQRSLIWKKSFPQNSIFLDKPDNNIEDVDDIYGMDNSTNIPDIVKKYELSGGNIINIIHYACIKAVQRTTGENHTDVSHKKESSKLKIYLVDVLDGVKKEMIKEAKPFTV
ncbi:ATP-binding protein [Chitinophagaceae bacterium 26-R-25]|nr:ATP-binding protein [Chitinophagaceae bacterium 26-R-25]